MSAGTIIFWYWFEGRGNFTEAVDFMKSKILHVRINALKLWPAANIAMYYFFPPQF